MQSLISKNKKKRSQFLQKEPSQKVFKSLKQTKLLSNFQQWWGKLNSVQFQSSSKVRIENRCLLTGRAASVTKIYRLSRIQFRELGRAGEITGLTKSSW